MSGEPVKRKLVTILYADIAGYSRLTGVNEEGTHRTIMALMDFVRDAIDIRQGKVLRYAGDAILAEFPSVNSCVDAAIFIQTESRDRNLDFTDDEKVQLRIGINIGEVIDDRNEIYGDGVNIAARLESIAPPGGICITKQVGEQIADSTANEFSDAGLHKLKNISRPIEVLCWPAIDAQRLRRLANSRKRWLTLFGGIALVVLIGISIKFFNSNKSTLPMGAKIAVLPFEGIGSEPGEDYFSAGLTADINGVLSKFTNLFVFAPNSVSDFRGNAQCEAIRDDLDVDYILKGQVRRTVDRVRVTTLLIDAKTCRQMDSPGPFDRNLSAENVLDIQLEIATKVAAEVGSPDAPLFNAALQKDIRRKSPDSMEAYECVLLSYWFYENFEPNRHRRARACLEGEIKPGADYSTGWSRLAFSYIESKKYAIDTPADWEHQARNAANKAIALDPDNPDAYYALAILTQMTSQDLSEFKNFAEKAIELNPNDAFVLADLGTWMGYAGQWQTAKEWVSRSMRLNPKHQSWLWQTWHLDYFLQGDYEKSRDMAIKMNLPNNFMVQASLTAAYALNGEQEKSEKTLEHLLKIRPDYADDPRGPFRARGMPPELIEEIMTGLRRAGLDVTSA